DDEWGTVLLEEVLGDIPDPHSLMREARRMAKSRLLISQRLGEGRDLSRLRQIIAKHSPLCAGKTFSLSDSGEAVLLVIPIDDSPSALEEFGRRGDLLPVRVVLKIGVPAQPEAFWGDIHYAEGFRRALIAAGHECTIQHLPEWEERDEDFDVVVHLKGLSRYRAKPCHTNIMWMINHPELHRDEELAGYDGLMVASCCYAEELSRRLERPVVSAPQAVDPERYSKALPEEPKAGDLDIVFIGNNHQREAGQMRPTIANLLQVWQQKGRPWKVGIWGKFWEGRVPREWIQGESASAEEAARLYRSAKIVLNDHHPDMKSHGFINERTFVIGACGGFQISDHVRGIEDEPIVFYEMARELGEQIEFYLSHPEARKDKADELQRKVLRERTFTHSAALLKDLLGKVRETSQHRPPAPMVSIIATTSNQRETLPRALQSAAEQTLDDWEMLLINNGGEDVSDIVRQAGDARIRYVENAPASKGRALNVGLRLARGRYIAYMEGADCYAPSHLETLVKVLNETPASGLVYTDYEEETQGNGEGRQVVSLLGQSPVTCPGLPAMACLHYRSMLEEVGMYEEALPVFAEWDMFQRLALAAHPRHIPWPSAPRSVKGGSAQTEITAYDTPAQIEALEAFLERACVRSEAFESISPPGQILAPFGWLEALDSLHKETGYLRDLADEQWQALERIRSSLPYRVYNRLRSFIGKSAPRKAR
ncbi:MAG: glycosyltransferase, partial [Armatimonadetes bacterium]|nr:glycosyltransferase [Armatimonadota bacterium]NIM22775.1 glycosyltransferase [Armatimonadota bacterium]NIM66642.1 glycosyltransferase [Armatimonadota bacterium]NIM75194.1 glycosyltransferase [Armatimonadota bacterium]NIN04835.1 glycosyltransferase [Armatimonadota bacterium]